MNYTSIALILLLTTACSGGSSYEESSPDPITENVEAPKQAAPAKAATPKKAAVVASDPVDALDIGAMPAGAWTDQAVANVELDGGLVVEYFTVGEGPIVKKYKRVLVNYQGWVKGTSEFFDSSFTRGAPIQFPVGAGGVIAGWDDGFQGMPVGSRARLHIPGDMGYGANGNPLAGIPGNAELIFDVSLVSIINN